MSVAIETELKLKLLVDGKQGEAAAWEKVCGSRALLELAAESAWRIVPMEAQYFDTTDLVLQKAGIAYRIRREGGEWVATVKADGTSDGGLHRRQEWNVVVADAAPKLEAFAGLEIGPRLAETVGQDSLIPVFSTAFERRVADISFLGSWIEVALDQGQIVAGEKSEPILEIELELKEGSSAALLKLAAALAREAPLMVEPKSKYYRALLLADLVSDDESVDAAALLTGKEPLGEAFTQLCSVALFNVFAAFQAFIDQPQEAETPHRLRVRLRRLRSFLALAKPCLDEASYRRWQEDFGRWGRFFGPTRDLDVLMNAWQEVCACPLIDFNSKPWLGEKIRERRIEESQAILDTVYSGEFSSLLLEFWAWAESRPWLTDDRPERLAAYAEARIDRWLDAMLSMGKNAELKEESETHRLRLQMKKIRYVLDGLSFFSDNRTEKLLVRLKAMQDVFGGLIDRIIANKVLNELMKPAASRVLYRDIGMLKGWQARGALHLMGDLDWQWKKLKRAARKWQNG